MIDFSHKTDISSIIIVPGGHTGPPLQLFSENVFALFLQTEGSASALPFRVLFFNFRDIHLDQCRVGDIHIAVSGHVRQRELSVIQIIQLCHKL